MRPVGGFHDTHDGPAPGFVVLPLCKECVRVIPERTCLARLRLGKTLQRRGAIERRDAHASEPSPMLPSGDEPPEKLSDRTGTTHEPP